MRLIIAGSRDIKWYHLVREAFTSVPDYGKFTEIVSGQATGVDKLGELIAQEFELKVKGFPADWKKYGKRAGYIRNVEMADYADEGLVIWDGVSKGSKHMIDILETQVKKPCHAFMLTVRPIITDRRTR